MRLTGSGPARADSVPVSLGLTRPGGAALAFFQLAGLIWPTLRGWEARPAGGRGRPSHGGPATAAGCRPDSEAPTFPGPASQAPGPARASNGVCRRRLMAGQAAQRCRISLVPLLRNYRDPAVVLAPISPIPRNLNGFGRRCRCKIAPAPAAPTPSPTTKFLQVLRLLEVSSFKEEP